MFPLLIFHFIFELSDDLVEKNLARDLKHKINKTSLSFSFVIHLYFKTSLNNFAKAGTIINTFHILLYGHFYSPFMFLH